MSIRQNIYIAVDAVRDGRLMLLLVRRKNEPHKGQWTLPGGFVEDGETLAAAALRELEEETGVKATSALQLHAFDKPDRDPRFRNISVAHLIPGAPRCLYAHKWRRRCCRGGLVPGGQASAACL